MGKQKGENMYFGQNMTEMILFLTFKKKRNPKSELQKTILSNCNIFGADDLFYPPDGNGFSHL